MEFRAQTPVRIRFMIHSMTIYDLFRKQCLPDHPNSKYCMMEKYYHYIFCGVMFYVSVEFLWEFYLCLRQHRVYKKFTEIPVELIGIVKKKDFDKARLYGLDKNCFNMINESCALLLNLAFLFLNGLRIIWECSEKVAELFGIPGNETLQSASCISMLNFISAVSSLPFNIYYTFVLEEKHGFNKQTFSFFLKDKIKKHIVQQMLLVPIICGIVYIVRMGGEHFFIYLWAFTLVVTLIIYTIYPEYIAPLFDKYTPLPEGEMKKEIEKLAKSVGFPLYKIYVVDGSKRSAHSNAYLYGLFRNKRVVLFDTLLKDYPRMNPDKKEEIKDKGDEMENEERKVDKKEEKGCDTMEVLAVLGHELGHWKLNHILKNFVIIQGNMFFIFFIFGYLFKCEAFYKAFGFADKMPVLIGLIILVHFVCLPYFQLLTFLFAILSRKFEFEADGFAKKLGRAHHLKSALIKLNSDNLSFPIYDSWYSKWHHSHPPLLERLRALDKIQ